MKKVIFGAGLLAAVFMVGSVMAGDGSMNGHSDSNSASSGQVSGAGAVQNGTDTMDANGSSGASSDTATPAQ